MIIPVILGPTSTGKTSLAVELCKKLSGQIISADSRQVYKHMDIGTGKLPLGSEEAVAKGSSFWRIDDIFLWGYDLVNPGEYFTAYDFAYFGLHKAREILSAQEVPLLVGGTGLYIDFFTGRIKGNFSKPDFALRKKLESKDLAELQKKATSLNLEVNKSDFQNKRRLISRIERALSPREKDDTPLPYLKEADFRFIGLTSSRDFLYLRADNWVDSIWREDRILTETAHLLAMGLGDAPQLKGFIYWEARKVLLGELSRAEAIQKTKYRVHAYIRRQQTYFKKISDIEWFDVSQDNLFQNVYNYIVNV